MTSNIKWLPSILAALLAPAAPAAAQDAAESPYFDIQWNSPAVLRLLQVPTTQCQGAADPNAAPIERKQYGKYDEWPVTLHLSMLRAMFYLAYDYYGMGLNHYFTLRQDMEIDFTRRFAAEKPRKLQQAGKEVSLVEPGYVSVVQSADARTLAGELEVSTAPGGNSTNIYYRHAIVDPFDQALLADQQDWFYLIGLSSPGSGATPVSFSVPSGGMNRFELGKLRGQPFGMMPLSNAFHPANPDGWVIRGPVFNRTDHAHYSYFIPDKYPEVVDDETRGVLSSFGQGMLPVQGEGQVETGYTSMLLCAQWRLQQERERAGRATASDRLLQALMRRAGASDEPPGIWVIPAGEL